MTVDSQKYTVASDKYITLRPSESAISTPYCFHDFWAKNGTTLIGKVASVNTDVVSSLFVNAPGLFPGIVGDALTLGFLLEDYATFFAEQSANRAKALGAAQQTPTKLLSSSTRAAKINP